MKNYQTSDYALNLMNKKTIVYRFADRIMKITLADYLAENPCKTEADFRELKELFDEDYKEMDKDDYNQTWKNVSLHGLDKTEACSVPSPEDEVIERPEQAAQDWRRRMLAKQALDTLTEIQQRRYIQHHAYGLSTWEIAAAESTNQKSVYESIQAAERKINVILKNG